MELMESPGSTIVACCTRLELFRRQPGSHLENARILAKSHLHPKTPGNLHVNTM